MCTNIHLVIPWCGHLRCNSLKRSHVSNSDSPSSCLKLLISALMRVDLVGGKYLDKNFYTKASQVVIEFGSKDISQLFALPFKENGNNLSLIASLLTPFILNVAKNSRKFEMCMFESTFGNPVNGVPLCTNCIMDDFISKFTAWIDGGRMLD